MRRKSIDLAFVLLVFVVSSQSKKATSCVGAAAGAFCVTLPDSRATATVSREPEADVPGFKSFHVQLQYVPDDVGVAENFTVSAGVFQKEQPERIARLVGTGSNIDGFDKVDVQEDPTLTPSTSPSRTFRRDGVVVFEGSLRVKSNQSEPFFLAVSTPTSSETLFPLNDIFASKDVVVSEGLSADTRRQFSKAHAILMLFAWLCFVPTAFLFARLGRDLYSDQRIGGVAVWFQLHRFSNYVGVVCMLASLLCIFISRQWTWTGIGSNAKYWTQVHTDVGVIAVGLAVFQVLNSFLRCEPGHPRRSVFNWLHRLIGIVAYSLALTALLVAAVQFRRIWNEPLMEVVLCSLPIFICVVLSAGFQIVESGNSKAASYEPSPIRGPLVFWSAGAFFASAMALSFLVANGYKK